MLFESPLIQVTADHGIATLWLAFPGEPVNALDLARLRQLDAALHAVERHAATRILVVRSALPAGFCAGLRPAALASLTHPSDRAAFASFGQRVLHRLAQLPAVTLAVVDGPCLGVGLELALACDYRLGVARITTRLGFPDRGTLFGGSGHLRQLAGRRGLQLAHSGHLLSAREARRLGLVDRACCDRRATIELTSFVNALDRRPVKRRPVEPIGWAAERRAFAAQPPRLPEPPRLPQPLNPIPPFPAVVGMLGDDPHVVPLLVEVALRGGEVVLCGNRAAVFAGIATAQARGFVTPLEAEQARLRVRSTDTLSGFDRAGLIFVAQGHNPFRLAAVVQPRAIVCLIAPTDTRPPACPEVPFLYPRRLLRIGFADGSRLALFPSPATDADTLATVGTWLRPFGYTATVFPAAARLLPRAA
jgi:enoyl-CoA hydratase/carnithine racemase